ncbi:hypothetical protein LAL4801_06167 [Roseibium aggregatum]|uniref:Uncharacterized protein n=1 Tax=Roseibium aggregatum TaxID=187304 RepID=A0A0M6YC77_9HYPH|nr:hypothetical protein LAL4801_06167 [Roseibium aggregatum]
MTPPKRGLTHPSEFGDKYKEQPPRLVRRLEGHQDGSPRLVRKLDSVEPAQRRLKNAAAANRLRKGFQPGDVEKIRRRAEQRGAAIAAKKRLMNAKAAESLSAIDAGSLLGQLRNAFRSPEERMERFLTQHFSRAKAIADGVAPEPKRLTDARHAMSTAQRKTSDAWFAKNAAWDQVKAHKENRSLWSLTFGARGWAQRNRALTAAAAKASSRHKASKEQRDLRKFELKVAEDAWKRDPRRTAIEEPTSEEKFDALRQMKLMKEMRSMIKEDPLNKKRDPQELLEEARERVDRREHEQALEKARKEALERSRRDDTDDYDGPRGPGPR